MQELDSEDDVMKGEQEPQLKYSLLEADAPLILDSDECTCFSASDKVHAIGCRSGGIHLLDFQGHQIQKVVEHSDVITGLSFDPGLEYLASCSMDKSVVVRNVYTDDSPWVAALSTTPTCVAINPRFTERQTREVAVGTSNSTILIGRGWLGHREHVLGSGEGTVHSILWAGSIIAWATDTGVRVYNVMSHSFIGLLQRPEASGDGHCSLQMVGSDLLLVGWPYHVQVIRILGVARSSSPGSERRPRAQSTALSLNIETSFSTSCYVLGLSRFGPDLAVLADTSPGRLQIPVSTLALNKSTSTFDVDTPPQPTTPVASDPDAEHSCTLCKTVPGADSDSECGHVDNASCAADADAADVQAAADTSGAEVQSPKNTTPSRDASLDAATDEADRASIHEEVGTDQSKAGEAAVDVEVAAGSSEDEDIGEVADEDTIAEMNNIDEEVLRPLSPIPQRTRPQLKILTMTGEELSSDSLHLDDDDEPVDYDILKMVCWYPSRYAHPASPPQTTGSAASDPPSPSAVKLNSLLHKWWQDDDEPLYFICCPRSITLAKPCDADDQALWLLERGKFAAALQVVETAGYARPETRQQCASAYLTHRLRMSEYLAAARAAPRLLGTDHDAWERLVFEFGQKQQLPILAPFVPTENPLLGKTAYMMVLSSFLGKQSLHAGLLDVLHKWPTDILKVEELVQRVRQRLNTMPRKQQVNLLHVLAYLYRLQGHHDAALSIYLRLSDVAVFAFIRRHHLYAAAVRDSPLLFNVDEDMAIKLLVERHEDVQSTDVCQKLHAVWQDAILTGKVDEARVWRRRLHVYLHVVFQHDRFAAQGFHDLQVSLYAEFRPELLLNFLHCSKNYHLEAALEVCRSETLIREQVYVLGRMGRAVDALRLIVNRLHDVPQAIKFVNSQGDDSLWDSLISLTVSDSALTAALLDQIGGFVDPLRLVRAIPNELVIPSLSTRLFRIINDFRTMTQLAEGCNAIIVSDCMMLSQKLMRVRKRPITSLYVFAADPTHCAWRLYTTTSGVHSECEPPNVPRDAMSFRPPVHTLGLPLQVQIAVHTGDGLVGDRPRGRAQASAFWRGMHALDVCQQSVAVRQLDSPVGLKASNLRVWLAGGDRHGRPEK